MIRGFIVWYHWFDQFGAHRRAVVYRSASMERGLALLSLLDEHYGLHADSHTHFGLEILDEDDLSYAFAVMDDLEVLENWAKRHQELALHPDEQRALLGRCDMLEYHLKCRAWESRLGGGDGTGGKPEVVPGSVDHGDSDRAGSDSTKATHPEAHVSEYRQAQLDKACAYIRAHGPVKGESVARHLGIDSSTFRTHVVPLLKQRGVVNHDDRRGYFIPVT